MSKYYTSLQKTAHFTDLILNDAPEISYLDQLISSLQKRVDETQYAMDDRGVDIVEIANKLESFKESISRAAENLHFNSPDSAYTQMTDAANELQSFKRMYEEYIRNYPDEQDEPFHAQFRELMARPADRGQAFIQNYGERKSASAWIDEAKAELSRGSYEPERYLARIIAARQLANAVRNRRANIDNTQLTDGQLEARTRQLLEDRTFRSFLRQNYLPNLTTDPVLTEESLDNAILMEETGRERYLQDLGGGHGGVMEEKLDAFIKQQKDYQWLDQDLYGRYQDELFCEELYSQEIRRGVPENQRAIGEEEVEELGVRIYALQELGIILEDGRIPSMPDGTPRVFVLHQDETGTERMMSLQQAGIGYNSLEFFKEMQKGNVFAYPAGDKRPVQIQLDMLPDRPTSAAKFKFSRPLSPEELCPYAEPVRPGFFTRLLARLGGSESKQAMDNYNDAKAKRDGFLNDARTIEENRGKNGIEERRIAGEWKTGQSKTIALNSAERAFNDIDKSNQKFLSIYGTTPKMREDFLAEGTYRENTFAALKPADIDLSQVKIGDANVSEEEFATLAMSIARSPKYASAAFLSRPKCVPFRDALLGMGHTEDEATEIMGNNVNTNVSIDYFMSGPRANLDYAFPMTVQPAREDAANAFKSYQQGDKAPLAKYLAEGIKDITSDFTKHDMDPGKVEYMQFMGMAGKLGDMLERDPELQTKAMQEYGLKESQLRTLKGMVQVSKLNAAAKEAKYKLANADQTGIVLGNEEKADCVRAILKANMAVATINAQRKENFVNESPKITAKSTEVMTQHHMDPEQMGWYMNGVMQKMRALPTTVNTLANPASEEQLNALADKLIEDKVLQIKPEGELLTMLESKEYSDQGILRKGGATLQQLKNEAPAPIMGAQEIQPEIEENIENPENDEQQEGLEIQQPGL